MKLPQAPPELIESWIKEANHNEPMFAQVAQMGVQWGAEQELEICVKLLNDLGGNGELFRRYRAEGYRRHTSQTNE